MVEEKGRGRTNERWRTVNAHWSKSFFQGVVPEPFKVYWGFRRETFVEERKGDGKTWCMLKKRTKGRASENVVTPLGAKDAFTQEK